MTSSNYTKSWAGSASIDYVPISTGGRLRYLKAGKGPSLLLMHTLRTQLDYFQRLIPLLTDHFTVYAVDFPGMGWSDIRSNSRYDERSVRRDLLKFIDYLKLTDFTIAGESMGGTLALSLASELGARVKHVVALNPYDYPEGVERANLLASIVIKFMRVPVIGLVPAKLENALILGGILSGGFFDSKRLPKEFVHELILSGHRPGYAGVETAYLRELKSYGQARDVYHRVKVPVTLVYGDHDWSKTSERDGVSKLIRGSRLITLEDTGHFASLEKPNDVARILIDSTLV